MSADLLQSKSLQSVNPLSSLSTPSLQRARVSSSPQGPPESAAQLACPQSVAPSPSLSNPSEQNATVSSLP